MDSRHGPAIAGAGATLAAPSGAKYPPRPDPFLASVSLRLDELESRGEDLRRALYSTRLGTPQADKLSADLLICEAEKMAIEGRLLL